MTISIAAAYVTLLVDDSFFPGVSVLSKSLKRAGSSFPFYIMVTDEVNESTIIRLQGMCDGVIHVEKILSPYSKRDVSWASSELTKLNIW